MSLESALAFLGQARHSNQVAASLAGLEGNESWDALVQIALAGGFDCTAEELNRAFALDWRLRWVHYHPTQAQGR